MKKLLKKLISLFEDQKKRKINLLLFILPFVIVIGIFGFITVKEVIGIININGSSETNSKYIINDKDYVLRDNATDYQFTLFTELKDMLEGKVEYTNEQLAESICKNYVADFYTWSNKFGQYDVGGLYYVYAPQKQTIYIQARDEFYKYINEYINEYGVKNLLEVNMVEATAKKASKPYEFIKSGINDEGEEYWYGEEVDTYEVKCSWTYVENEKFNSSKYAKRMNFKVIDNNGRFEIIEAYE